MIPPIIRRNEKYALESQRSPLHWQGRRIRNIHEDYIHYPQRINLLVSHRFHEAHEERIVTLAFAIRPKTLGKADKRGRSDALSVEFVKSV